MNKSFVFVAALALLAGAVDGVFLRKRVESDHDVEEIVKPKQSLRRESQVVMNMGTRESVESKKSWKSWMNGKSTRKTYNARKYTCDWENRVECIDTTKKRSYRRETRIAICHYDKWRGDYETRCIKECDIDKHLKHFEDDYCGECIEDELSATKAPNKNANKCNCYSDCDDHDLCTIDQIIHENNEHFCVHTPKICVEGYSCNPADGECSTQAQLFVGQSTIPGLLVTTTESPDMITKTTVPESTTTAIMTTLIPMTTATAEIATSTSATSYVMSTSSTGATIATTSPTTTAAATITPTPKMNDSTSMSPPSNLPTHDSGHDLCNDAIPIEKLPTVRTGTTEIATPDFDSNLQDTCGIKLESRGVWYSFHNQKRRVVRLEYQLYSKAKGNSELAIFQGSCSIGNLICVDNIEGNDSASVYNKYNDLVVYDFLAEEGENYLFLLTGERAESVGEYEYRVSAHDVPDNDSCEGAVKVRKFPSILKGTTLGATPDFDETTYDKCGIDNVYTRGLWYSLVGRGKVIRLEYQLYSKAEGDSELSVFAGKCGDLECVTNIEGKDSASVYNKYNELVVYEFLAEEGENYQFLLAGERFKAAGDYELKVTEYDRPVNDECKDAIEIDGPIFIDQGTTLGATPDFDYSTYDKCGIDNVYTRGLWYSLVGRGTVIRLEYQLYSKAKGNSELSIFTGSCGDLVCMKNIEGNDSASVYNKNNDLVVYEMLAEKGERYSVLLSGEKFTAAGDFSLSVTEYDVPINDECKDATEIITFPLVVHDSTAGATPDFNAFNEMCGATADGRGVWYSFSGNNKLTSVSYSIANLQRGSTAQISLFSGPCKNLVCEEDFGSSTLFDFVPKRGKEYRILLSGDAFATFKMTQYDSPQNDSCDEALLMTEFPFSHIGDLKGATSDFKDDSVKCGNGWSGIWFSFVGSGKAYDFELKTTGTDKYFNGEVSLFQGQCDELVCVTNKRGSGENAIVNIDTVTTAGIRYMVFVSYDSIPFQLDSIPFQLSVTEIA